MTTLRKPILVLGASGCVGRALTAVWPRDVPVIWQYRSGGVSKSEPAIDWDILNEPAPQSIVIGGILLLAGAIDSDPLGHNILLAQAACDLGQRQDCRVLIASSQAVYNASPMLGQGDLTEDQAVACVGSYGAAKLAMEAAVAGHPHVDTSCLRIANVIGCDMLLKAAAAGPVMLDCFSDGRSPQRNYIGPVTLAYVVLQLFARSEVLPAVMNIAQPGPAAMMDLLAAADVAFTRRDAPPTALRSLTLDLNRLMEMVFLARATPASLITEARLGGWRFAR